MTLVERPISILMFGATGQLGRALLASAGSEIRMRSLARADADFLHPQRIAAAVMTAREVDVVINAAAYTAVDKAESEEPVAHRINADAVGTLAEACRIGSLPLIHVSTNYVFDGEKAVPYTEDDPPRPLNAYGRSKHAGEEAIRAVLDRHVIVRTSGLYSAHGTNFVRTMLRLGRERSELRVVDDQFGAPTSARSLAGAILTIARRLVRAPPPTGFGTFHYADKGEASWHAFARAIFTQPAWTGIRTNVIPIPAAQYLSVAVRPRNGRLDCTRIEQAYGLVRPHWQDELARLAASEGSLV